MTGWVDGEMSVGKCMWSDCVVVGFQSESGLWDMTVISGESLLCNVVGACAYMRM